MADEVLENVIVGAELSKVGENPFFPESKPIDEAQFNALERKCHFNFVIGRNEKGYSVQFGIVGEEQMVSMKLNFDARQQMDKETLELFRFEDDGKTIVFPKDAKEFDFRSASDTEYTIDGLAPRESETVGVSSVGVERVAKLLISLSGNEVIFYTGAGVSMGGEKPVWGMAELMDKLKIEPGNNSFDMVFKDPKSNPPDELLKKVSVFGSQLYEDVSTPAHKAIAEIVKEKEGVLVLTENIDLKHEAEGSRISVVHMDSEGNAFQKVKQRTSKAKILITAGLSHDDRAIIQYLKQQRPDLIIVAFAFSEDSIPNYLDEKDMVIIGDVQENLPKVASKLRENLEKE